MTYGSMAVVAVGLLDAFLLIWAVSAIRRIGRVESRLGQLTDALTLLTETAESGFRATLLELARVADLRQSVSPVRSAKRPRRPVSEANRAPSLDDLITGARLSRGEARLRLHLAEAAAADRCPSSLGESHGALRVS